MKTLNLINRKDSDINYTIHFFPDGEVHIEILDDLDKYTQEGIRVLATLNMYEVLFLIEQVDYILNDLNIPYELQINYLLSQRMDRVMGKNRACSLDIILDKIYSLKSINRLVVVSPHNIKKLRTKIDTYWLLPEVDELQKLLSNSKNNKILVFPDKGAKKRYEKYFTSGDIKILYGEKIRDEKGNIISYDIIGTADFLDAEVYVIDDLIDGGRTFVELSKILSNKRVYSKTLIVCHAIQYWGIKNTSEHYDTMYISNSFKEWKELPENVKLYDIKGINLKLNIN